MTAYYIGDFGLEMVFSSLFKDNVVISYHDFPTLTDKDVVFFGGGEDISPGIYGDMCIPYCHSYSKSMRDLCELNHYERAVAAGAGMVGICRGAQFLCASNGGKLIQHVERHGLSGYHPIETEDSTVISVTSTHHQMMYPYDVEHKMLGWTQKALSSFHLMYDKDSPDGMKDVEIDLEPEVVYFPKSNSLGIQYHPEYMGECEEGFKFAVNMVKKYVLKGL